LSAAMAAKAAFSFRAEHIWLSRPINGDPHEMSRGLGQTEQEILALIEEEGVALLTQEIAFLPDALRERMMADIEGGALRTRLGYLEARVRAARRAS